MGNLNDKPVAWISDESLCRLLNGGNDSRGTVPVHSAPSNVSKEPLYMRPRAPLGSLDVVDIYKAHEDEKLARWELAMVVARAVERAHGIGGQ